jgi:hypothetical protein
VTLTFAVTYPPPDLVYDPVLLYTCNLLSDCNVVTTGIFRNNFTFEANASSFVSNVVQTYVNCSANPRGDGSDWLSDCNLRLLERLFAINSARVENLNTILTRSLAFNASCTTDECRGMIRIIIDSYTPVAIAAATSCSTPTCIALASGSSATSLVDVLVGGSAALAREKIRFDLTLQSELLQKLEVDTFDYISCRGDAGCQGAAAGRTNTSFAVHGYINQALGLGFRLADNDVRTRMVAALDANFTRCVMNAGRCTAGEVNSVYRQKRAILRYLVLWSDRLNQIAAGISNTSCVAPACNITQGLFVVCCLLFAVCCLLFVVCCLLFVVCCLLFAVCCLLFVVCCLLFVVCCLLFVVCCLLFAVCCLLFVVCCLVFGVCCF